jgi:hypothetical protein
MGVVTTTTTTTTNPPLDVSQTYESMTLEGEALLVPFRWGNGICDFRPTDA